MSISSLRVGARLRAHRTRVTAMFVTAALAAGGFAAAPALPASAAQPTSSIATSAAALAAHQATAVTAPKASRISLSVKNRVFQRGARTSSAPLVVVTVRAKGTVPAGSVRVSVAGKSKTAKLSRGKASVRLTSKLPIGTRKVTVTFVPKAGSKVKSAKATTSVTAKRYSSRVLEVAARYVGTPYRYGGSSPRGFDCSGFTSYVYRKAGVKNLAHSAASQRRAGKVVSRAKARPGDLIYTPGHIAIYAGGNKMIDAPRPGQKVGFRSMWQRHPVFVRVSGKAISL